MTNPFKTANPQTFKLRIVWGFELKEKMVAEFSDSSWLPRVGEIMILPIEEVDEFDGSQHCHKFKVQHVAYDFPNQMTRIICKAIEPLPQKKPKEVVLKKLLDQFGSDEEMRYLINELAKLE